MTIIKILYVEDHPESRKSIEQLLPVIFDCAVETANDGLEGIKKATDEDYRVIIMDIGLPDIDGIEVARRIREHKPNQVIISSSGYACLPEDTVADAFDANFVKPFSVQLKEFSNFCQSKGIDLVELE